MHGLQAAVYLLGLKISSTAEAAEALASLASSTGTPVVVCNSQAAAAKYAAAPTGAAAIKAIDTSSDMAVYVDGQFGSQVRV